jgi:hypothetical protein
VDLLLRRWERGSKLSGAHRIKMKLMAQLQTEVPDPLSNDLPCLLACCGMTTPAVGILFLVADQPAHFQRHHGADTAPRHHWR